jgi:fumarylacetoacetate (FAA) hydrolase
MILATRRTGGRDGTLLVVAPNRRRALPAIGIAPTLQAALDDWERVAPALLALAGRLASGAETGEALSPTELAAPLPRAFEWLDASAFLHHVRLARQARGAALPPDLETDPLVYQGGSGVLLGPRDPIPCVDPSFGVDLEAELGVILGDVPLGVTPARAASCVRLLVLLNDVTLRELVPSELAKGFGFVQSKPSTAFAPFALTPDELGPAWRDGRAHVEVRSTINGARLGACDAGQMHFPFPALVAHVARTRALTAGTILGSGTVSNPEDAAGVSCLVERRMREKLTFGAARTPYLAPGDTIGIQATDAAGTDLFGSIEQRVEAIQSP